MPSSSKRRFSPRRFWSRALADRPSFWTSTLMALCVFLSAAELATTVGYSLDDSVFAIYARSISALCVLLFWLQEVIRIHLTRKPLFPYLFEHKFDFVLLLAMLLLPVAGSLMPFLDGGAINIEASLTFPEIAMHCIVLVFGLLRGIRFLQNISLSPGLIFILSFAVLISIGTILLLMPNATVGEEGLGFVDAAFFATSAVCVTGLVPVESMPETLSTTGQMILLVLCQLGGLGVMTITYFFAFFFDGGLSIRNRFAFGDLFNERNVSTIGVTLFTVVLFTAIVETLGAVAIYFSVAGTPAVDSPVYFSIFHSIMAFCNAGFSIVPDGLCNPEFVQNTAVLSAIGILTVFGALGFPVVRDLTLSAWTHLRRRMFPLVDQLPQKMMTHTRVVMVTTLIVSVAGTLILWLTEQGDFFSALFSAFASRTAGFAVTDTATLSNASLFVMMVLMLIGGAPFSTAGGIKVTTFAIAILALKQYLLGRRDLEIFGRRLDSDIANQALAIVLLTLGLFALVAIVVCALHPEIRAIEVMFESVSAVGTVGLSCGITAKLCWIAKLCLIFAMFIGRIGVLLFFASFISKRNVNNTARYPETTITL